MKPSNRRDFLKRLSAAPLALSYAETLATPRQTAPVRAQDRPNILVLMSDNHSWNHLGCYGDPVVRTPNIDRVAERGVRFTHAFCAAPSCAPARAAMLSGQEIWRLEEGANLWGVFPHDPVRFPLYTDLLAAAGYHVGSQGKGWGPGSVEMSGRRINHAGPKYESFTQFLASRPGAAPWTFWFSSPDPHRAYEVGSGVASGLNPARVRVPAYLPDNQIVRSDICDYYREIERFDRDVGEILQTLERAGEADNTLVVVCSDNGWQMPRGLANLYDSGGRVPLVMSWAGRIAPGRVVDDFASLNDLAPTFLELAGLPVPPVMTARSLAGVLASERSGRVEAVRQRVFTGRERHALCRELGKGYPGRAVRTHEFLYIRNYEPDRWPAGDPPLYGDVDAHMLHYPSPTKMFMLVNRAHPQVRPLFDLAFAKRPAEELYDLRNDPEQMNNVAGQGPYSRVLSALSGQLQSYLRATEDPREVGGKLIWDTTMYYQPNDFIARPAPDAIQLLGLQEAYNYMRPAPDAGTPGTTLPGRGQIP